MAKKKRYRSSSRSVSDLKAHLVLSTKYRAKCINKTRKIIPRVSSGMTHILLSLWVEQILKFLSDTFADKMHPNVKKEGVEPSFLTAYPSQRRLSGRRGASGVFC